MTSPTLLSQTAPRAASSRTARKRPWVPFFLFCITLFSTTAVGMRYMYNFHRGLLPLSSDADVLPYVWVWHNLRSLGSGLPFSLTLITILLAHEFGHFFACRHFRVRSTLPYMLPAPSLSGTFGAVIRLKSRVPSRSALLVIGAAGPIAGFVVAIAGVFAGLLRSTVSPFPSPSHIEAPLLFHAIHALLRASGSLLHGSPVPLNVLVPHPVLSASWIGLFITALNLIPAGQLDGGHIIYALSPRVHGTVTNIVKVALLALGLFCWIGWLLWGVILFTPAMRHPPVPRETPPTAREFALVPVCAAILLLAGTLRPFPGYSLLDVLREFPLHSL